MSRSYWRVSPAFWGDEKVMGWSEDARFLALYLLTCPHRTAEGLFRMPIGYALSDLGWTEKRYRKAFDTLSIAHFAEYDEATQVCFIVNALDYQAPEGPKQRIGALNRLALLPETYLFARLYEQAKVFAPEFADTLPIGYRYPIETQSIPPALTQALAQTQNTLCAPDGFDAFWALYPFKVGRLAAEKAFRKALTRTTADRIIEAMGKQAAHIRAQGERGFKKHPTTWLNEGHWDDEVEEADTGPEYRNLRDVLAEEGL